MPDKTAAIAGGGGFPVTFGALPKEKLIGIQFGRAVAAILVVFYHAGRMLPMYIGNIGSAHLFAFGNAGVDFFFVLSGFIIYYVHHSDINQPNRVGHYLFRRFTRIYPIYWAITALGIAILVAKRDWADLTVSHLLASFLLAPEAQLPIIGVAWTLWHEVFFYLIFAVLIVSRAAGILVVGIWSALVVTGAFSASNDLYLGFIESPYHIEFGLGAFAAYLAVKHPTKYAAAFALLGIAMFLFVGYRLNSQSIEYPFLGRAMYGTASMLIVYGLAVWERQGGLKLPGWAAYLGAASYSIYLVHTYLLGWFGKAAARLVSPGAASDGLYFVVSACAVAGGCLTYQFLELRLQHAVRRFKVYLAVAPT